ncbi:ferritin family protein [Geoalkalibacter subterraneus]|uniref:Rubrerythrin diiron-binding domain-containing protein n=1 Tax=Geoalkalibacter subterraneus TaxID=483547 RepID=A0A0B5FPZ2_9BACT|nr:ferritin family protein [Geoalkalibacter subterraneus]AJF06130.1 hypothetical protein GSUB_05505 [Geoalkalibacter subterraneus]
MPQEYKMKEALKTAIHAKKNLMDFYKEAASMTDHPGGKKVLLRLADEVRENAKKFYDHYRWDDLDTFESLIDAPTRPDSAMIVFLRKALDKNIHERKARELAMKEHEDLEKTFRLAAKNMVDPQVKAVFEEVAKDARNHYAVIESEYAHTMGMVHETDIDTYVRE